MEPIQPKKGTISILVAEDDKIVRTLLKVIIPRKFPDATIYLAEDGRMGVELFKEHAPPIVITDINMPVMDGIEMAGEIRSMSAAARIIVVTAYEDSDFYEKFDQIGIDDYIIKPIVLEKLFTAIEKSVTRCGHG